MGGGDGKCGGKQITIDRDFYMGVYPVTQEEWHKVVKTTPSHFRKGGAGAEAVTGFTDEDLKRFPVESVSWKDCQAFVQKLNAELNEPGWKYCLPSEAHWEYACRGAATTQTLCGWNFYFESPTNTLTGDRANFNDSGLERTLSVGLYEPNSLGIFDMHGNVAEWCEDAFDCSYRVIRGGSWNDSAENCRAAYRGQGAPTRETESRGLRRA